MQLEFSLNPHTESPLFLLSLTLSPISKFPLIFIPPMTLSSHRDKAKEALALAHLENKRSMDAALVAHREEVRFAQDCAVEEARQRHDQVIIIIDSCRNIAQILHITTTS